MSFVVTCGPNEAIVISGFGYSKPSIVVGGRSFVLPCVQQAQKISLNTLTLSIESHKVYTQQGVPVSVTGIAQVKIEGQNKAMLRTACQQFLSKDEHHIMAVARETLEGHQRAIMGTMTIEEIYKDRKKFSKNVFEVASSDLVNMGIIVVSYTIKDIKDDEGYLDALGKARTAEVKRDARMGEAEAKRDAQMKEAIATQEERAAKYLNDTEIAKAQRDYNFQKATYDEEVNTRKAEAELAYSLQAAKVQQKIADEKMQVKVIERSQAIQIQEQEILRKEKELEAEVRKPAEAEKYRLEKLAEANKARIILEAEAEAEAIRIRGEAEAFALQSKAEAEAKQLAMKAAAFQSYEKAAKIDMLLRVLPDVAKEVATPLTQVNRMVMVSSKDGEVGAAKIAGEILDIVSKTTGLIHQMTGVEIGNQHSSAAVATRG